MCNFSQISELKVKETMAGYSTSTYPVILGTLYLNNDVEDTRVHVIKSTLCAWMENFYLEPNFVLKNKIFT